MGWGSRLVLLELEVHTRRRQALVGLERLERVRVRARGRARVGARVRLGVGVRVGVGVGVGVRVGVRVSDGSPRHRRPQRVA